MSSGADSSATTSRASTTLSSSPALIRPTASATARAQCSTGRAPDSQTIGPQAARRLELGEGDGVTASVSTVVSQCPPAPMTDHHGRNDHDGLLRA